MNYANEDMIARDMSNRRKEMIKINQSILTNLIAGKIYNSINETITLREKTIGYCLVPGEHCHTCDRVYKNFDCHRNIVGTKFNCEHESCQ